MTQTTDTEKSAESAAMGADQKGGGDGGSPATPPVPDNPYATDFWLWRIWAGLPGRKLGFHLRIYLSRELSVKREQGIGMSGDARKEALIDFRVSILADCLIEPPVGFPDFPASVPVNGAESTKLSDRAYEFFSRTDEGGRRVFAFLVEDVVNSYWEIVLPSPTLPASAS
jgi:hypothetical protein